VERADVGGGGFGFGVLIEHRLSVSQNSEQVTANR
jgi:hypothetical protein